MSDSEAESSHNDADIEQCLRKIVREAIKKGDEITVNQARSKAEQELGLEPGFLKSDSWKSRSKDLISAAVEAPSSPELPKKPAPRSKPAAKAGTKRKSNDAPVQRKKQKRVASEDEESEIEISEESEDESKAKQTKRTAEGRTMVDSDDSAEELDTKGRLATKAADSENEEESELSEPPKTSTEPEQARPNGNTLLDDSDDFSDVIDEPAPKKKRQKKSTSPKPKSKAKASSKPAKAKPTPKDLSPDEEEIKRLQGWLVKCGIRKVWGVELKKCDTSKDKIRHLKNMLSDAGMTGRFSAERAKQIKEQRELAAELEETKAFNEKWGDGGAGGSSGEEVDQPNPPRRRLKPKGLVDFSDSGGDDSG